jgi:hypothetical protein
VALSGCGSHAYVPLTAANIGSTMAAATKNLHTAHEVSTSNGATTTIDFDTSGLLKYRVTASGGSQSVIGIGADRYVAGLGTVPAGKWLKVPSSSTTGALTFADLDPIAMVVRFNKGLKTFTYVGPTKIAGVQVQHYRIAIDQRKYLQATGQGLGSSNLGSSEVLIEDLFLNDDNTLRRVTLALPGGVGTTQVDVTNWGKPTSIVAPPASAVVTAVPSTKK